MHGNAFKGRTNQTFMWVHFKQNCIFIYLLETLLSSCIWQDMGGRNM